MAGSGPVAPWRWRWLPARSLPRISDTRVFLVPEVTNAAIGVVVEHDIAARPVQDRASVRVFLVVRPVLALTTGIR